MNTAPSFAGENSKPIDPPPVTDPAEPENPPEPEQPAEPEEPAEPEAPSDNKEPEVTTTNPAYNDSHQQADGTTVISGILLVNKQHPLPADYVPSYTGGAAQSTSLQGDADAAAKKFLADCNAQGNNMYVLSGYRSYNTQANLFASYAAANGEERANTFSARAGQSEHQTGLAFDVGDAQHSGYNLQTSMENLPGVKWMMQHCAEYGFILRYPKDKIDITGYQYEPWHFRYVGVDAATNIMASGMTLEEYLGVADTKTAAGRQKAIGRNDNAMQIDGEDSTVASYNIKGHNYFRLRDLASMLASTDAEFDIGYDDAARAISIHTDKALTGAPSLIKLDRNDIAVPNNMDVLIDGDAVEPTAYNIDGFTYFKLRDMGELLNFDVVWDNDAKRMVITTAPKENIIDKLLALVHIGE